MERKASKLREENHRRHPAWEWDDRILELLETYEDELIAAQERHEQLEHIVAVLQEEVVELTDQLKDLDQAVENERKNSNEEEYLKQLEQVVEKFKQALAPTPLPQPPVPPAPRTTYSSASNIAKQHSPAPPCEMQAYWASKKVDRLW